MTDALPAVLTAKAAQVLTRCQTLGLTVALAESCTGGLVAAALTSIDGASLVVERGFVTYSNQAKTDLLGVPAALLDTVGAVSAEVAEAMTNGVLAHSPADLAAAITGIAGPGGATPGKPVGTVFVAAQRRGHPARVTRCAFPGDRDAVRAASTLAALDLLLDLAVRE